MKQVVFLCVAFNWSYVYGVPGECPEHCSLVENCGLAWSTLKIHPLNKNQEDTLKSAYCGYTGEGLKVCCHTVKSRIHPHLDLLPKNCGFIDGERVVGGNVSGLREFPWMALVSMSTKDGPRFLCGGSVINSRYVLTAGHCVANKTVLGVRVGEHDLNEERDCERTTTITCSQPVQDIPMERIILHQKHSSSNGLWVHDIALIRLQRAIDLTRDNARPICLPTTAVEQQRHLPGLNAVIAGWGASERDTSSNILLKAYIPFFTKEDCISLYESDRVPTWLRAKTATFLCAGVRGTDACQGDSGGPLMVSGRHGGYERYIQYGIASFGEAKCGGGRPSLYTDVVLHMPWILDNLEP